MTHSVFYGPGAGTDGHGWSILVSNLTGGKKTCIIGLECYSNISFFGIYRFIEIALIKVKQNVFFVEKQQF